jgi:hypothetical protein
LSFSVVVFVVAVYGWLPFSNEGKDLGTKMTFLNGAEDRNGGGPFLFFLPQESRDKKRKDV